MDLIVKTVYQRRDIEGFYAAFLAGKKPYRISQKALRILSLILAISFWLLALLILVTQLTTGNWRVILGGLPVALIVALLGLFIYSRGHSRFRSRAAWKAYPNKGEELIFHFLPTEFVLTQPHSETKSDYSGLVRLCEDKERFYLFITPQTAHILPKRDFPLDTSELFRRFITDATGLPMSQGEG